MNKIVSLIIVGLLLVLVGEVYAQDIGQPEGSTYSAIEPRAEESAPKRKLKKTWIKTEDGFLGLSSTAVDAFTPTTVKCPGKSGTCTVRVEVSSQFWDLPAGEVIQMRVEVDGSPVGVFPSTQVNVDSTTTTTGNWASVRTFSWIRKGLSVGYHTVDVEFLTSAGTASAGYRTLMIEVYKP